MNPAAVFYGKVVRKIKKTADKIFKVYYLKNKGFCPCCAREVVFFSEKEWLRDYYLCPNCGSIPRERALMTVINKVAPDWVDMKIHESSPEPRGTSTRLKNYCRQYTPTQFFPDKKTGLIINGFRNENLEKQTFKNGVFDIVISQDVMEHLFNPGMAFSEIARTLKKGGFHIFTVPLVNGNKPTEVCAEMKGKKIINRVKAEYHGNPVSNEGSLVTRRWGDDITVSIYKNGGMISTIYCIDDLYHGIKGKYIEVIVSRKIA